MSKDNTTVEPKRGLGTVPTDEFVDGTRVRFLGTWYRLPFPVLGRQTSSTETGGAVGPQTWSEGKCLDVDSLDSQTAEQRDNALSANAR